MNGSNATRVNLKNWMPMPIQRAGLWLTKTLSMVIFPFKITPTKNTVTPAVLWSTKNNFGQRRPHSVSSPPPPYALMAPSLTPQSQCSSAASYTHGRRATASLCGTSIARKVAARPRAQCLLRAQLHPGPAGHRRHQLPARMCSGQGSSSTLPP